MQFGGPCTLPDRAPPTTGAENDTVGAPEVGGVGGELAERGIHGYPVAQPHLGPRVIVEAAIHVDEARDAACRDADRARERRKQLCVLARVTAAHAVGLQRIRHVGRDGLAERVVHPRVDALGHDTRVAFGAGDTDRTRDDRGIVGLQQRRWREFRTVRGAEIRVAISE